MAVKRTRPIWRIVAALGIAVASAIALPACGEKSQEAPPKKTEGKAESEPKHPETDEPKAEHPAAEHPG
jgi:hypothetical protein